MITHRGWSTNALLACHSSVLQDTYLLQRLSRQGSAKVSFMIEGGGRAAADDVLERRLVHERFRACNITVERLDRYDRESFKWAL
jgi:hypothetical protein